MYAHGSESNKVKVQINRWFSLILRLVTIFKIDMNIISAI